MCLGRCSIFLVWTPPKNNICPDILKQNKDISSERMIKTKEDEKQLYKDAVYFHLLRTGYSNKQAKMELKRIFEVDNK